MNGPWIEPYPDFGAATRVHPVVLPFRRVDLRDLEVVSPPGYAPGSTPPPVSVETPFGSYLLAIERMPHGFHVKRSLVLTRAIIPVEEYQALRAFLGQAGRADDRMLHFVRSPEAR